MQIINNVEKKISKLKRSYQKFLLFKVDQGV
jgi:hypothetical protein